MCPARKKLNSLSEVLKFTYPKLHTGGKWYVDFYAYDPADGKMRRKKYHLDNIEKIKERRKRANELIESLTKLLREGWSPWVDADSNRAYTLLEEALNKYEAFVERMPKYKTRKSYTSRLNILRKYNAQRLLPIRYVYQFDTAFVSDFLDYIFLDREVNPRTRNNYRQWCQSLAAFFIEKQYMKSNPVEVIKDIAEVGKKRQPLSAAMLKQLESHLRESHPYFYLACMMEYYTFIRPEELSHITLGDISIKEQSVFISAAVSKNKRDGKVGLNDKIIKFMIALGVFQFPNDYYLFGPKVTRPSATRGDSEMFRRKWNTLVRKGLGWSDCYQFYSLKDSGLRDLANSEGIVIARDQARHTDVSTTNKYLQGRDAAVHEETKHFKGNL
ncbi:MAG: tyrosine-type recombinase/integrase [Muribaculaceae bacterium]|nr:tyrosine-type recombinase/integrase [Muribaculaceae bacterium]